MEAYKGADRQVDEAFIAAVRGVTAETLGWLDGVPPTLPMAIIRSVVSAVFVVALSPTERDADGNPVAIRKERQRRAAIPPVDSFFFEDLRLVLRAVRNGNGGLVERFLAGTAGRIDCTDRDFVASACTAATHPRARWPSGHACR